MGIYKDEILKQAGLAAQASKLGGKALSKLPGKAGGKVVGSFDDIVKTVGKAAKGGNKEAEKLVRESFLENGTGSFVVDGGLGLIKKVFKGSADKINDAQFKYLKGLNDMDAKAGAYAKKLFGGKTKVFDSTRGIKINNAAGEAVQQVPTVALTAPVSKVTKKATPFLAAAGASSILYPDNGDAETKGGGEFER